HIVALQFCLRQLGGNQRSDKLEGLVRAGLDVCAQGIAAFRRVDKAVSVRNRHQSDSNLSQARRFEMLAAEYHAVADQMQNEGRASYRRIAETYEALERRFRGARD